LASARANGKAASEHAQTLVGDLGSIAHVGRFRRQVIPNIRCARLSKSSTSGANIHLLCRVLVGVKEDQRRRRRRQRPNTYGNARSRLTGAPRWDSAQESRDTANVDPSRCGWRNSPLRSSRSRRTEREPSSTPRMVEFAEEKLDLFVSYWQVSHHCPADLVHQRCVRGAWLGRSSRPDSPAGRWLSAAPEASRRRACTPPVQSTRSYSQ
jgi:hypothetical protein